MESNRNNNNNNNDGGDKHQQLPESAQNRKSNKLANDEDKPTAAGEDQNCSSNKNLEEGNDLDLEVESLSREELIKLVRKQMAIIMEMKAQTQLETIKKEAEESASSRQSEEFSQRIIQLEQKNVEVHADLHQKMTEIEEMHKEVKVKSEQLTEKAKQIDALLTQLKESPSHQHLMSTEQEMKIQLSLETWYDWLGFVPRHQLGQVVPQIGDRKFGSIVQKFLHEYGEITIDRIKIVAPYEEDPSGPRPRVRARKLRYEMAEAQMPANIKNFNDFELKYFDQSVLNFMQKFKQNGLLDNVNLWFDANLSPKDDKIQPVLCHILPLINGIVSIYLMDSAQLVEFYDVGNSKEIYERNMKMMETTRILALDCGDPKNLHANKIDLYCRWLYQTARADGKPRQLLLFRMDVDSAPISLFIDRLKQDFLMATDPVAFFIKIALPKAFQPLEAICLDNDKTKERFQTKMENANPKWDRLQISRHPLASTNKWIAGKEYDEKTIYLCNELQVVPV